MDQPVESLDARGESKIVPTIDQPVKKRARKGTGSVIKRRSGYALVIDLGTDTSTKKRTRRWITGKTKAEVQRRAADLRAAGGGSIHPRAKGTVADWMTTFLDEQQQRLTPNAFVGVEGAWRLHAAPLIGRAKLEDFGGQDAARLLSDLHALGRSPSVIRRTGKVMSHAFRIAIRRELYRRPNPFTLVDAPRVPKAETRILTRDELHRFLVAAEGTAYEALWVLLVSSGLRLGEALALRWRDIDLKNGRLIVRRSFVEVAGVGIVPGPTKNRTSRRPLTIGARTSQILAELARRNSSEPDDLAFPNAQGGPWRRSNLRRHEFLPILERAGLGHFRIHDLRHGNVGLASLRSVAAKTMAERLGHSSTKQTTDTYGHLFGEIEAQAAAAIESALWDDDGPSTISGEALG